MTAIGILAPVNLAFDHGWNPPVKSVGGLLVTLTAILDDLGGEFRDANSIKFSGICQVQKFMLRHNAVGDAVHEDAVASSERTSDCDAVVSQRLKNSANVFTRPQEAKDIRRISFGRDISLHDQVRAVLYVVSDTYFHVGRVGRPKLEIRNSGIETGREWAAQMAGDAGEGIKLETRN